MTEYLTTKEDRIKAIENNTDQKFKFQHQKIDDIPEFKDGIYQNFIQQNEKAGKFVRDNKTLITDAAKEFGIAPDLVKAVIYTEMARGWYDKINPLGSRTFLPGNIDESWQKLITGSDVHNKNDNIRLTAKLLSQISKRLDNPNPEDVYSLYNGMAHDRTYQNRKLKSTPYFLKKVLEEKAWEKKNWELQNPYPQTDELDYLYEGAGLSPQQNETFTQLKQNSAPQSETTQDINTALNAASEKQITLPNSKVIVILHP